jgi:hypothetical protein
MSDSLAREFEQWLAQATEGLPEDVCAVTQDELRAHYEDAVAEFVRKGETAVSAHQLALKSLGGSSETRQGLRDTHLAGRRYKTAVLLTAYGLMYAGIALVGIGFLSLSCTLSGLKKSGNIVLTALRYLCFVHGIALVIAVTAVVFQSFGIAVLMLFILIFILMISLGAMVLLFLQATAREKRFEFTV